MRPVRFLLPLFILAFFHASRLAASQESSATDQAAKQPPSQSIPDSHAPISLDIVATDKAGSPIPNLSAADFIVLDNKQPQRIASVRAIGPANAQDAPPIEIILAIDAINAGKETLTEEFDWLHKYLDSKGAQLNLPTSFAFLEDQAVRMQNHPTRDTAALARFLDSNRPGFRALRSSSSGWGALEREEVSLRELDDLAAQAKPRPGRKILIWIGPGWGKGGADPNARPIGKGEQSLFARIVALWDELRNARITLDMINPTISGGRIFDFNYESFLKGASQAHDAEYGHLMLPALAAQSGGLVLYGSSDLPALIDRCVADTASYYVLTFDPPPSTPRDVFHAIEIKVDRPGIIARTRTGYYSQP